MLKTFLFSAIVFGTGVGIPIMAAINAGLGAKLANPVFATVILMTVGLSVSTIYMLVTQGLPNMPASVPSPISFTGGFLVVFYVLSVTAIAPKIGLGNAIFLVLLGQIASTSAIDHFGLFGAIQSKITLQKFAGILFMTAGIVLARKIA